MPTRCQKGETPVPIEVSRSTEIIMRVAHLTLIFMAAVYILRIRWILKFEAGRERTPARGAHRKAITHAYATLAMPWKLPSTRKHWFRWLEFALFHLAVTTAIAMTFLIPYAQRLIDSPAVIHSLQATFALGGLIGLSRLVRRLARPEMRVISSVDDIFSLAMLALWMAAGALAVPMRNEPAIVVFFLLTTFFMIYIPFSKISHYIYWPFIRFYLGKHLGHRGVYPPKAVPRHG
jgi:nitrate reductase gamma subunit